MSQALKITDIKQNPKNPRVIKGKKFRLLVKSLIEFPKMMELRPVIYNEEQITLGGNMRLAAVQEIKKMGRTRVKAMLEEAKEENKTHKINPDENLKILEPIFSGYFPAGWVKGVKDLTEDEQKRFVISDNSSFGEWDFDILANEFEPKDLIDWGLDEVPDIDKDQKAIDDKYTNENAEYPIVPEFDEKHNAVVIICRTETELAMVKTKLKLPDRAKSYKNSFLGQTNVITAKEFIDNLNKQ